MKLLFAQWKFEWVRTLGGLACMALLAFVWPLQAQESESSDAEEEEELEEETEIADDGSEPAAPEGRREETLVVTGSRLVRDTYTSISPLQIIDAEESREAGLIDASEAIQESTTSSGQQIDVTFNGYVLDDGPGAATANLRGLGAGRTLVLVNGRRVAPAGVEGAPSSPDLNLLMPFSLIQRVEFLLDGASSIYGSDAIAGVVNIILREDFDGVGIDVSSDMNQFNRISNSTITATWGYNFDRGFVGVGASLQKNPEVTLDDVAFTGACDRNVERDQFGNIRHKDAFYENVFRMKIDDCSLGLLTSRVIMGPRGLNPMGSIYFTEGRTNIGVPNFSDSIFPVPGTFFLIDSDGDGWTDISYRDYSLNGHTGDRSFFPKVKRKNLMAYGEYTVPGDLNITPFFEIQMGQRVILADSGEPQLFPWVPAANPFNPCNPAIEGGEDCIGNLIEMAESTFHRDPGIRQAWLNWYGLDPIPGGSCDQLINFFYGKTCAQWWIDRGNARGGPIEMRPIISVRGDRNITATDVRQIRQVYGVSLDLPFIDNIGSLSGWSGQFDLSLSSATGISNRSGIREDRLNYALGWFNLEGTPCVNTLPQYGTAEWDSLPSSIRIPERAFALTPDVTDGCVPINMFARSLYRDGDRVVGDFETQAERDYVFDSRDFDTHLDQTLISFFMSGAVMSLPNGAMLGSYGFEVRTDTIESNPDNVARDGLFFGFFVDQGATGERTITEHFSEFELPIFDGGFLRHELTVNFSARLTKDEFFESASTWSAKVGYRPNADWFIRATSGTSYRTPNLRNLFLKGQTGFLTVSDPCLIPGDAVDPDGNYIPDNDRRNAEILQNCRNAGVDPTKAHNYGLNRYSVQVNAGGAADTLTPENSRSQTFGIVFEQPWTNDFDLYLSWTYYLIEVEETIISPPLGFIMYDCYGFRPGKPVFCDRIHREDDLGTSHYDYLIDLVDISFINRDLERSRGYDYNVGYDQQFTLFDQPIQFSFGLTSHRMLERFSLFLESSEDPIEFESHSDWYYPRWRHSLSYGIRVYDWRFRWTTQVLSPMAPETYEEDPWRDAFDLDFSDTCLGAPADQLCRDVEDAGRYFEHAMSMNYVGERMFIGFGMSNVLDTRPPIVNGTYATTLSNHPLGTGYDLFGRGFFLNFSYLFSGG